MPQGNVERVAQALNLSVRRVQQLTKEGMPKESHGRYDAVKCMLFYIRYLQAALEKKCMLMADGSYAGARGERIRLLRADADLREMEVARERGQLIAMPDFEKTVTDLVLTTKARMMAIPPRLAPELVGENSRLMIQAKLDKAISEALSVLPSRGENRTPEPRRKSSPGPPVCSPRRGVA